MIIARSPLRISLGGGGTDLASYSRKHGGFVIAAAIDKYIYITVQPIFVRDIIVKYSKLERVQRVEQRGSAGPRATGRAIRSRGPFQAVIWHLLVSHPRLQRTPMRWESLDP